MPLFHFGPEQVVPLAYLYDAIILIVFFSENMFHLLIFCERRVDFPSFRIPYMF